MLAGGVEAHRRAGSSFLYRMDYIDYCSRNLSLGLYVAHPAYNKFAPAFIYDKGMGCNAFCPVDNQEVSVEDAHIVIAVRVHGHKDGGRRMLYIKGVEVEPYVFIALSGTWESCNHFLILQSEYFKVNKNNQTEYYLFIPFTVLYFRKRCRMEAADFWNRIKEKLSEKGKTQEWLCNETGMDLQAMRNRIYKSRFPSIEEALRILSVFDTTAEDFFGISNDGLKSVLSKDVLLIPVMEQAFSAGHGQFVPDTEEVKEYIAVPKELKKFGDKFAASRVKGDSMEPTLFSGDIIISDLNGYDGDDGIYTIIYKGRGFVKRLQRTSDGVKIISDNRHYDPMFETAESEDFRVIGKVRSVVHNM